MPATAVIDSIVEYYSNLLIVQYHNKPKAKAMIEAVVREMLADGILFDVRDAYSVETAVGAQLDIIAKYVGVDRFFLSQDLSGFFSMADYADVTFTGFIGLATYADFETKEGAVLTYDNIISQTAQLTDSQFRTIIKLKIVQNNINHSHKSIDEAMFAFFGDTVIPYSFGDMTMEYLVPADLTPIIDVAIQKQVLPKPMGVELTTTSQSNGLFLVEGRQQFESVVVFTRASDGTFIDAAGDIDTETTNEPRFTYSHI